MRKILILCFLAAGLTVSAEELSFITVLSSPVGVFNKLETVDVSTPAVSSRVNFCTQIGTGGTVNLRGQEDASLGNVVLAANAGTVLGRISDGDYVLDRVVLNSSGHLTGSRLLGEVINVSGEAVGKSDNYLYSNTLTVAGAKTTGLNVNNKSIMQGTGSANEMVWSNEYQSDSACTSQGCAQQYLLKTKGKTGSVTVDPIGPGDLVEIEYDYYWEWSNSDSPADNVSDGNVCSFSCASTVSEPSIGFGPKPIAVTKAADAFTRKCEESTLGSQCSTGGTIQNGSVGSTVEAGIAGKKYCPIYVCTRVQKN